MKKKLLPALGIIIFSYLLFRIGLTPIADAFLNIDWKLFLIATIIFSPIVWLLQVYVWGIILKNQNVELPLLYKIKIQLISMFYGTITPGALGSFIKVWYIKDKLKKSLPFASYSVILNRVLDIVVVLVFSVAGALVLGGRLLDFYLYPLIVLFFILAVIFLMLNKRTREYLFKTFENYLIPKRFKKSVEETFSVLNNNLKPKTLIKPTFFTVLLWLITYFQFYLLGLALGINVPFVYYIVFLSISTIIALIPITINGLGTREATIIFLFSLFNVPQAKVFTLSILILLVGFLLPAAIGAFLSLDLKKPSVE